jgi:hypothetical protein
MRRLKFGECHSLGIGTGGEIGRGDKGHLLALLLLSHFPTVQATLASSFYYESVSRFNTTTENI